MNVNNNTNFCQVLHKNAIRPGHYGYTTVYGKKYTNLILTWDVVQIYYYNIRLRNVKYMCGGGKNEIRNHYNHNNCFVLYFL